MLLTDVKEVLPLLQRNYENNISPAALRASGQDSHLCSCGKVSVAELDWSQQEQYARLCPPAFDYVLAADCIYHETLLRHLYRVMLAVTNERSTSKLAMGGFVLSWDKVIHCYASHACMQCSSSWGCVGSAGAFQGSMPADVLVVYICKPWLAVGVKSSVKVAYIFTMETIIICGCVVGLLLQLSLLMSAAVRACKTLLWTCSAPALSSRKYQCQSRIQTSATRQLNCIYSRGRKTPVIET